RGHHEPGRHRPDAPARQPGLLRLRRAAALRARRAVEVAAGLPLRPDAVPCESRYGVGGAAVPHLLSVGVPALPAGLQADDPEPVLQLSRLREQWRQRQAGQRVFPPGHLHHGRASRASVLSAKGQIMRRVLVLSVLLTAAWTFLGASAADAQKLRIVTSTTDLKALTEAVTGDLAEVDAMARPNQNPHDLEVRPSLMVKVRRADAMIVNGLELDAWADVVAQGANNANVIPGSPGHIDASRGVLVLEVPTTPSPRPSPARPPPSPRTPWKGWCESRPTTVPLSSETASNSSRRSTTRWAGGTRCSRPTRALPSSSTTRCGSTCSAASVSSRS